jgi:cyclophilin family peptidyl-prolyl cis-trans isomerase
MRYGLGPAASCCVVHVERPGPVVNLGGPRWTLRPPLPRYFKTIGGGSPTYTIFGQVLRGLEILAKIQKKM